MPLSWCGQGLLTELRRFGVKCCIVLNDVLYGCVLGLCRWYPTARLPQSKVPRLYHASAVLMPDASVLITGSNPNTGLITRGTAFATEFRIERFRGPYLTTGLAQPVIIEVKYCLQSTTLLHSSAGYGSGVCSHANKSADSTVSTTTIAVLSTCSHVLFPRLFPVLCKAEVFAQMALLLLCCHCVVNVQAPKAITVQSKFAVYFTSNQKSTVNDLKTRFALTMVYSGFSTHNQRHGMRNVKLDIIAIQVRPWPTLLQHSVLLPRRASLYCIVHGQKAEVSHLRTLLMPVSASCLRCTVRVFQRVRNTTYIAVAKSPPSLLIAPPTMYWLYVLDNGVPNVEAVAVNFTRRF